MENIYDYIIIGAGPAGCFCGIELTKKGLKVCIFEKNVPKCCKEWIFQLED